MAELADFAEVIAAPESAPVVFPWASVVIPTYGAKGVGLTRTCIQSLRRTHAHLLPEIIVVSDGDDGDVLEALKSQAEEFGTGLARIDRAGFAVACNVGLRAANGQVAVFLVNNDVTFETHCLQVMAEAMLTMHGGLVGCRLLYPDRSLQHAGVAYVPAQGQPVPGYFDHLLRGQFELHVDAVVMHEGLCTGALLGLNRDFLERSGYLDERFGFTCEDIDACLRGYECGLPPIYCGYTYAVHHEGASRGRTPEEKQALEPEIAAKELKALQFFHQKWMNFDLTRFSVGGRRNRD